MMTVKVQTGSAVQGDEEIVERILKGEKHLYEGLMRKYNARMFRISMSVVNDQMEAEDIMQTSYINAYLQLAGFQGRSGFSTWLTRILINESLLRKKKKLKEEEMLNGKLQETTQHGDTPLKSLMNKELKTILEKTISELPDKYKMVFVMREIENMSVNETMDVLKLSESNVKVRLNRSKEMLRNSLSSYYKSEQVYDFNLVRCDVVVNAVMGKIGEIN